jgi:hypothetical protein
MSAPTTTIKVRVDYSTTKVEEAKAAYLKEHLGAETEYGKALTKYKTDKARFDTQVKEFMTKALKSGRRVKKDWNSLGFEWSASERQAFPDEPVKPTEPKIETRQFDLKLSLLKGAADDAISIKVADGEWSVFL